jgi:predicted nucleotidyltransferase
MKKDGLIFRFSGEWRREWDFKAYLPVKEPRKGILLSRKRRKTHIGYLCISSSLGTSRRMNTLEELKFKLETLKPILKARYKVETIGIFGSYSRGEQTEKSDLDILVTFSQPIGVYRFIEVEGFIKKKLGVKVDLVQKGALLPMIKEQVLNEIVLV